MDRRSFNKLATLAVMAAATPNSQGQMSTDVARSGQGSPVTDSDRLFEFHGHPIALENDTIRIAFDSKSGALVEFLAKRTGWNIQREARLAESFRIFAPTAERSYSPVLGTRNPVSSIVKSSDGKSLTIRWDRLESEYNGTLDVALFGTVRLEGDSVHFDMTVKNDSPFTIASVEWPIIGALDKPESAFTLRRLNIGFGTGHELPIYPRFLGHPGYFGTNFPTQTGDGRYTLILSEREGLYIGKHDRTGKPITRYAWQLKPGYSNSAALAVPTGDQISGHLIHITNSVQHFPFTTPAKSSTLANIVLCPFVGDWHQGADVYRRWFSSWFQRPPQPDWIGEPHTWQQLQINSSEDDLRTKYKDLPQRLVQSAKAGVKALQLVGWNKGGQDRGNPSHDTDPRLGTFEDLKDAIAKIEKTGVRVILFNKYTWADTSTEWYKKELYKYMALDANGIPYAFGGYHYQTPEQLADMNTRRFAPACLNDERWLQICSTEFQKSIDLGASGILYDEAEHHGGADLCFSTEHGHEVPASLWAGDIRLAEIFRKQVRGSRGEKDFLLAGEALYDLETQEYSLSYIRLVGEHLPVSRYNDPGAEIMIAVPGFDDREMINSALRYRYIMSFEPFNFKGDLNDFPLTLAYGQLMQAFRLKYRAYVWDAEFRDTQDASVLVNNRAHRDFSVFVRRDGKRSCVVLNQSNAEIKTTIRFAGSQTSAYASASPERSEAKPSDGEVLVAPRSVVLLMET